MVGSRAARSVCFAALSVAGAAGCDPCGCGAPSAAGSAWRDEVIESGVRLRDHLMAPDGTDVVRYEWLDYFAFDWEVTIARRSGDAWTLFDRWDDDDPDYRGDAWWIAAGTDRLYLASPAAVAWSPLALPPSWTDGAPLPLPPPTPFQPPGDAAADPVAGTLAVLAGTSVALLDAAGVWTWEALEPPPMAGESGAAGAGGIVWDDQGRLHVCYPLRLAGGAFALRYALRDPGGWTVSSVVESASARTAGCDVAAGPDGLVRVAYVAFPGETGFAALHVAEPGAGGWVETIAHDRVAAVPLAGRFLAVDPAGGAHVVAVESEGPCAGAYARCDGYRFVHGAQTGAGWAFEPVRSFAWYRGEPLWIGVTSEGAVHVAWQDYNPASGTFDAHLASTIDPASPPDVVAVRGGACFF